MRRTLHPFGKVGIYKDNQNGQEAHLTNSLGNFSPETYQVLPSSLAKRANKDTSKQILTTMENSRCYIESLPSELLLPVLTYLPDLESLDNFLIVSPAAYRAFETRGLLVFKTVLSSGGTHTYSCALICIIALIRAGSLPATVHDLESLRTFVVHETTPHRWNPPIWAHPISSWPSDLPTNIIRSLLITNRKVQRLTVGCLEYYLTVQTSETISIS